MISTVIVFVMGMILGITFSTTTDSSLIFKEIYFIFGYFLKLFTFLSFLLFITVLLKRVVFVFLSLFIWWIFELMIYGAEFQSKMKLMFDSNGNRIIEKMTFISDYLPLNAMSNLIKEPFQRIQMISDFTGIKYQFEVPYNFIIVSIAYSCLFIWSSYMIMQKRDW
jgi:ABC-type transport system involved in multi-copper enzyme maturation permease subunit